MLNDVFISTLDIMWQILTFIVCDMMHMRDVDMTLRENKNDNE